MKNKLEFNNVGDGITNSQHIKIQKFLKYHKDKQINVTYEAVDSIRYWIHQYYRGYLLPDIIESWGEYNSHMELKKMFLLQDIFTVDDIPIHHRKKCMIFLDNENIPVAYMPSMSVLTNEEATKYILKCENFLYVEIMGCMDPKHQEQAQYARSQFV